MASRAASTSALTSTASAIRAAGIRKAFGDNVVLDGIDLDVAGRDRLRPPRAQRGRQDHASCRSSPP